MALLSTETVRLLAALGEVLVVLASPSVLEVGGCSLAFDLELWDNYC